MGPNEENQSWPRLPQRPRFLPWTKLSNERTGTSKSDVYGKAGELRRRNTTTAKRRVDGFPLRMWKSPATCHLVRRLSQLGAGRLKTLTINPPNYSTLAGARFPNPSTANPSPPLEDKNGGRQRNFRCGEEAGRPPIGKNVSRRDKISFLVDTLHDLKDDKEAVYGALDAWVAWEQEFPIASLRKALVALEKEHQWHRIIQVIKWMLSKGQGKTMGTYRQLIRALDMDHRAEEAHNFWMKKIGSDLHSVPWQLCHLMISVYYRNNMLERLIKLFRGLEAFNRKPPEKSIVQKVANAYEMSGMLEEKERLLQKYNDLFNKTELGGSKKLGRTSSKKKKSGKRDKA